MSTSYKFLGDKKIKEETLIEALKELGLEVSPSKDAKKGESLCITCGTYYIWFYLVDGVVYDMVRYGGNYDGEETIIAPIAEHFGLDYVSEYEDEYWDDEDLEEEE